MANRSLLKLCCANCECIVTVISDIDRQESNCTKRNRSHRSFWCMWGTHHDSRPNCKHSLASAVFANLELSIYNLRTKPPFNIFSENCAFLKIMKQDLTEFWNNNLLQISQKMCKYEYKNGEYKMSLNSTKNTRMH